MRRLPGGAVTALGITQLIGWGTSFYLPAVFAHRIAEDTGWSLTLVFAAFSWNLIVAGAMSRRIGEMIDRLGAPRVMTIGSALMAMGLLMLSTATTTVQLFAAWTILGVASRAALYDAAFAALAAIFGQGARRAISLLTLWGGLASTVFWPLGHFLVEAIDWRWSTAVYALLNLAVAAYIQFGWGDDFVWIMVAYAVIQALDGNLLVPLLFSDVVNLHPIAIIVAILFFGGLWGLWGVFFAIPLATLVQAVLNAWPDRDARGDEVVVDG